MIMKERQEIYKIKVNNMNWQDILKVDVLYKYSDTEWFDRHLEQEAEYFNDISEEVWGVVSDKKIEITDEMTDEEVKALLLPHMGNLKVYRETDPSGYDHFRPVTSEDVDEWFEYHFKTWLRLHRRDEEE